MPELMPYRAVSAAAQAVETTLRLYPACAAPGGSINWGAEPREIAHVALCAALPHIRAQIADEIMAYAEEAYPPACSASITAFFLASEIVRGGK